MLTVMTQARIPRLCRIHGTIQAGQFEFGSYMEVNHAGWANLPETQQFSERSRCAGVSHCGLQALDDHYRSAGTHQLIGEMN